MARDIKDEIILSWSNEDQALLAQVPELPGCAVDGATHQGPVAHAEVVIRAWIETTQDLGRRIPAPAGACCRSEQAAEAARPVPRRGMR